MPAGVRRGSTSVVAPEPCASTQEGFRKRRCAAQVEVPSVFGKVVLEHIRRDDRHRGDTMEVRVDHDTALERLGVVVASMWADETSSKRRNLWGRLEQWALAQRLPMSAETAALFVLHRRETAGTAAIRKGAVRDLPTPWSGKPTAPQPGKRAEGKRGGRSAFASSSHVKGAAVGLGEKSNGTFEARGAGVLEVGFPVGRSARADVGAFRSGGGRGSDRGLGDVAKTPESKPVRAVPLGGLAGGSGRGDRKLVSGAGSFRSADGCHHRAVGRVVAGDSGDAGFYGPLDKTRRRRGFDASDGRGKAHRRVPGITTVEARRRRNQHLCNNDQVFVGFRGHRPSAANVEGHHPAVVAEDVDDEGEAMEAVARLSPCTTHSIIRRGKRTRLPSTAEERSSPLHVSGVETMDVDGLRSRMTDVARERFDQVWNLTFYPEVGKLSRSSSTSSFAGRHAAELLRNGVARAASGPGRAVNVPFTVVEEKPEGLRQRFILWTRDANGWAEEAYEAHVPLFHISKYLDRVLTEVGSTRDFKTGFYAIEIPEEARDLFRFKTTEGEWFELCRLPMGHVCAPELMHSLAAAAAGDPAYVRRQWAARDVGVDVFIDNIRYTGTEGAVLAATVNLDAAAADFRLTWKPSDSNTAVSKYTFLGVDFDHEASSVMPSAKIRRKLAAVDLSSVTASQLESMAGRLMHASAIAAASPGKYWYALKFLRRLSNGLNRGVRQVHDVVSVPVSVAMELRSWSAAAVTRRVVAREPVQDEFTTFVDASLRGWGGVVVNDRTAEVTVLGMRGVLRNSRSTSMFSRGWRSGTRSRGCRFAVMASGCPSGSTTRPSLAWHGRRCQSDRNG